MTVFSKQSQEKMISRSSIFQENTIFGKRDDQEFIKKIDLVLKRVIALYQVYNGNIANIESLYLLESKNKIHLTPKQVECLIHLAMGKSIKRIALFIGCSQSNIEGYICRLKRKFGLHTTDALITFFWQNILGRDILDLISSLLFPDASVGE
jgi:DNA-binding CsgD family transcriptional regulator